MFQQDGLFWRHYYNKHYTTGRLRI